MTKIISELQIKTINDLLLIDIDSLSQTIILNISEKNIEDSIYEDIETIEPKIKLRVGISEKINNEFYILDNYIIINKQALIKIIKFIPQFIDNKQKQFKYTCIKNIFKSKNLEKPKYFIYMLIILCGIDIYIPNV